MTKKHFWQDGLNVKELKVAALLLLLFIFAFFAGKQIWVNGDISPNLLFFLQTLVAAVAGVKAVEEISNRSRQHQPQQYQNYEKEGY